MSSATDGSGRLLRMSRTVDGEKPNSQEPNCYEIATASRSGCQHRHVERQQRWERAAEWPLTVAALAFLAAYAAPIVRPSLPVSAVAACGWVLTGTWIAFGVDYAARQGLAERRWQFVRSNVLDLVVIALPLLRPLRLLRLVALLSVLNRAGARSLRGRVVTYVCGATVLLIGTAALAVTEAERGVPGATITSAGDGLWWAVTTITTVGYGDRYPVSATGRVIAVALMLGGIALLGVVTATIASWLVDRVQQENEQEQAATRAQVRALADEVSALRLQLLGAEQADVDAGAERPS